MATAAADPINIEDIGTWEGPVRRGRKQYYSVKMQIDQLKFDEFVGTNTYFKGKRPRISIYHFTP